MTDTAFNPDPSSDILGCLPEVPYHHFHDLPDHPAQRQTKMHAVDLLKCGALNHHLQVHRQVDVVLVGDIDTVTSAYADDPLTAVAQYGSKLNGHTRDYIWTQGARPKPETLRITVHFAANEEASLRLYNSMDAQAAAKRQRDIMQSTLNVADIEPISAFVQKAANLKFAVEIAMGVLCGSVEPPYRSLRAERLDRSLITLEPEFYHQLPNLGQVQLFKNSIIALDSLDLSATEVSVKPPSFVAAYLSILQRNPDEGREFLERLKDPASGEISGTSMDAFAVIKSAKSHYWGIRRYARLSPTVRMVYVVNCILNVFDGWLNTIDYVTDQHPHRANAIGTFNPVMKRAANTYFRQQERQRAAEEERAKRQGGDNAV